MADRPLFQRAPRIYPNLPGGEIEIPAPPSPPSEPKTMLVSVLLPAALAVGMLVATVVTMAASQMMMAVLSLGFMGVSSLVSLVNYVSQKREHKRATTERLAQYRAMLENKRRQMEALRDQQLSASREADPEPTECVARAQRRDSRLWERSPHDEDFLRLRVGTGRRPFLVNIKAPKLEEAGRPDPLAADALKLRGAFAEVDDAPVVLPLAEAGAMGVAGPRERVREATRALLLQIATHHSPDEVKIVAVFPADEGDEWLWLRWLPHTWAEDRRHRYLADDRDAAHRLLDGLHGLLGRRRQMASRPESRDAKPSPALVFVLADPNLVAGEPILPVLLQEGKALGAFSILLADSREGLLKGCRAVVELHSGHSLLIEASQGGGQAPFRVDAAPVDLLERLGQAMAPIRLQTLARPGDIPTSVPLLSLLGVERPQDLDVAGRWQRGEPYRTLAVPIGLRAGARPLMLDLHESGHGPNGLVAGTVGSGKTELVQSLIAALAVNYHPHEVAFVLLDFKGGDLLSPLRPLPHVVNTLTDLELDQVPRALLSLEAELARRERLFGEVRANLGVDINHIDDYLKLKRQGKVQESLPYLVLIADEFTVLKSARPDDMQRFVTIAVKGRGLGFRMILMAQKPAGVISEQIDANSRFRLCLRVARMEDSQDVLRRPDAADLTGAGRAYLSVDNNRIFELFQAAWSGAPYAPGVQASDPLEILAVNLDGSRNPVRLSPKPLAIQAPTTQLQAVVAHLSRVAQQQGIRRLPGAWLPPLPQQVALESIRPTRGWDGSRWQPATGWMEPMVGLLDDPAHQAQPPLTLYLAQEGNLAVYGAPGSGKTTLLETLVTSLAMDHSPEDVHLYLLDFGGRTLTVFTELPHVGAVILADEAERLQRLLRYLAREMEERRERFGRAGVNTLPAYRRATGGRLPAIVVMLDNYAGFFGLYPDSEEALAQIARDGKNLGVHLVLTAGTPLLRPKLTSSITMVVALELADRSEYANAIGRLGQFEPPQLPGRGLIRGNPPLEFHTALPAAADSEAGRSAALRDLAGRMQAAWTGPRPAPIGVLPDVVPLCSLLQPAEHPPAESGSSLAVPLGLDVETLAPFSLDLRDGPHFLVTGTLQSGKTTLLRSWLLALGEVLTPEQLYLYLVDFGRAGLLPLRGLPHMRRYADTEDSLDEALVEVAGLLKERRGRLEQARQDAGTFDELAWMAREPAVVVACDDFDLVNGNARSGSKQTLEHLIRRERGMGLHVLVAALVSELAAMYDGPAKALKELQTGFILGSSDYNDVQVVSLRLPGGEGGKPLPSGQGYYTRRGRYRQVKIAHCQAGPLALTEWVARIRSRCRGETGATMYDPVDASDAGS